MRYHVTYTGKPDGHISSRFAVVETELRADRVEFHPSGALIFWKQHVLVMAFGPDTWHTCVPMEDS